MYCPLNAYESDGYIVHKLKRKKCACIPPKSCNGYHSGARRFSPVTTSPLHFRPFSGHFGPHSLDRPKLLKVRRRFGHKLIFDVKQKTNSVVIYILLFRIFVN